MMGQVMMCKSCMSNYYLYDFLEVIDNEKIEKFDTTDDDLYILHVKRYAIMTCSGLER
jgi:hypothetical protein